jgi:predicted AlkP superfamily phosphohydrolase/phosphomutase/tetratricopeptide (TPR) repeat protein
MGNRKAKKVLLIGWDAADWKIINPLLDSGQMPSLAKLIANGVIGNIATLDPPLSPMLWTSIATGKTADKHGILGFSEPDPNTGKIRPASVTSRKVKAVWNILQQNEIKSHVVGWWPSHPAEPIDGVYISNMFAKPRGRGHEEWPLPENCVHPKELENVFREFRVHPDELTGAHILPFIPEAAKIDQEKDKRIAGAATLIASVSSYHAATTWILENKEWDFVALYLNELDLFSHTFMKFHPPQLKGMDDNLFQIYKNVVNSAYKYHDMMLGRLMELAGDETTIILVSDHGFHSDHLRPTNFPTDPAAPALEHAPYGILCISGPGIKKDERVYGATLLDITPTVLSLFGIPVGKDMNGRTLGEIFSEGVLADENIIHPSEVESWENIPGNSGQHSSELREDPWVAQEALKQLVELGYIEAPGENDAVTTARTIRESKFYLARVFLSTNRPEEAIKILEELFSQDPDVVRFGLRLAFVYEKTGRYAEARKTIDTLRSKQKRNADLPQLDYLEGSLLFSEGSQSRALDYLRKAEKSVSHLPGLHILIGRVYLRMRNWVEAERAFIRALAIDADNPRAHHGLALASLRMNKIEIAVEEALNAVGLLYHFPAAHYHLGEALFHYGDFERAAQAFEVCAKMTPGNRRARHWLVKIYSEKINQPEKAKQHKEFISKNILGTITIVSGLPRSGTSMAMQMLKVGGMATLSDDARLADENNPKGYLEDERVKKLHLDNKWLKDAEGKAMKVVAPLLQFLPSGFMYKIIFMERDMEEVLVSQQKMIRKNTDNKNFPVALSEAFTKQLEKAKAWIKAQPHVEVLFLNYADVISDPLFAAEKIGTFIDEELNSNAMANVVSENLYRNKKKI